MSRVVGVFLDEDWLAYHKKQAVKSAPTWIRKEDSSGITIARGVELLLRFVPGLRDEVLAADARVVFERKYRKVLRGKKS